MVTDVRSDEGLEGLRRSLDGVEGYFSIDEAWALNRCVYEHPSAGPLRIVEIGSYKGRSTIAIGLGLLGRGRAGRCVSIDPHAPTGKASYTKEHGALDTFDDFTANIAASGIESLVESVRETSERAAETYDGAPIDVLFIDGSHDYQDVVIDIALWEPFTRTGSVIAFNDPYAPGVNRAIREYVTSNRGFDLARPYHVNNTLFLTHASRAEARASRRALLAYLFVERQRFKLFKLFLKGIFEARGIVYRKADAAEAAPAAS